MKTSTRVPAIRAATLAFVTLTDGHASYAFYATLAFVTLALAGVAWTVSANQEDVFYHDVHAGLFPLCTGCHSGIPEGDRDAFFPTNETCDRCHTEEDLFTVNWSPPGERASNLLFEHDYHAELLEIMDYGEWTCADCHSEPGDEPMSGAGGGAGGGAKASPVAVLVIQDGKVRVEQLG